MEAGNPRRDDSRGVLRIESGIRDDLRLILDKERLGNFVTGFSRVQPAPLPICGICALRAPVISAKAGTQSSDDGFSRVFGAGSRFRGNDRSFQRDPTPNDASNRARFAQV